MYLHPHWLTDMDVCCCRFAMNAFTDSGRPQIFWRNAVRHLESMFNLIRCQSRSVMPKRSTRWPTPLHVYTVISKQWSSISFEVRTIKAYQSSLKSIWSVFLWIFCLVPCSQHTGSNKQSTISFWAHITHFALYAWLATFMKDISRI